MKHQRNLLVAIALIGIAAVSVWLSMPSSATRRPAPPSRQTLRIGLVPEHDIFDLQRSYGELAHYLALRLDQPVKVLTARTYDDAIQDLQNRLVDAGFVGALVAVTAAERSGAQVLLRPEMPGQIAGCRSVVFVRADSPIRRIEDLGGHSFGVVSATFAGCLFPLSQMNRLGILRPPAPPRLVPMGTYDDVIAAVASGRVDAGAAKDLRLAIYQTAHPDLRFRPLATSPAIPQNALVVRAGLAEQTSQRLAEALTTMCDDPDGRRILSTLGIARFVVCRGGEFAPVHDAIAAMGDAWALVGVPGPPPTAGGPQTRPASSAQ